ncbi:MAG: type IV pilus twitching motility protein PilT [Anaerolineae bacterium]|nr:type IV pilus twitching motility protein PilT [Anaerolineae bacterium]
MELEQLCRFAVDSQASDLFIKAESPPALRVHGRIVPTDLPNLTNEDTKGLAQSIMNEEQIQAFEDYHELDLAFTLADVARFRCNIYVQRGSYAMVLRIVPLEIKEIEELGLPKVIEEMSKPKQGLVLVTGPTGCGKSTTLAAMIDLINRTRYCNVVTIEDPIEFVHDDKLAIASQREVGIDTESFYDAMKFVVRESPDVILIGEMRDAETMRVALTASETGHLVFSTVHTTSASDTVERIVSIFPPHEKSQICLRLSTSLLGIVSQKLVPRADGTGRVPAVEVMINTPTVAKLIEEGRSSQIYSAMNEGGYWGMQTMNQSLVKYWRAGVISEDDALTFAGNLTELKQMLRRGAA